MSELVGAKVGRYRVTRVLGQGGMGTVYEGVQAESGAAVAIKVLSERFAQDKELLDRFFSEARATNVIAHENIVQVHDLAQLPDGRPYIVMELLAGKTLREIIDEREPLPIGGVLDVVTAVLGALAATHAAGIVHRDIKPDNIFVTAKGRAKVLDFGVAKLSGANALARTQTGVLLGTPEYMAPEQITDGIIDERSDIYAAGILLFEALVGERPYAGKSDFEVMRAHVEIEPPRASSLRSDLPSRADDVIRGALAKDPRDRFASANAMANALRYLATRVSLEQWRSLVPGGRLATPKPPSIPPSLELPSSGARATIRDSKPTRATVVARPRAKPAKRSRRGLVLACAFALAGVAGGLIATQVMRNDAPAPRPAARVVAVAEQPPPLRPPPRIESGGTARTSPKRDPFPISARDTEETDPLPVEATVAPGGSAELASFDLRTFEPTAAALAKSVMGDAKLTQLTVRFDVKRGVRALRDIIYEYKSPTLSDSDVQRCIKVIVAGADVRTRASSDCDNGDEIKVPKCFDPARLYKEFDKAPDVEELVADWLGYVWRVQTTSKQGSVSTYMEKDEC